MHRGMCYIEIYHTAWNVITPCVPGPGCTNGRKCCRKVKSKNGLHHRCLTTCPNCLVLRTALTCGVSQVWCNPKRLLQNRCTNTTYDRGLRQKPRYKLRVVGGDVSQEKATIKGKLGGEQIYILHGNAVCYDTKLHLCSGTLPPKYNENNYVP